MIHSMPVRDRVIACLRRHPEWTELFLPVEDFLAFQNEYPFQAMSPLWTPMKFYGASRSGRTVTVRAYHGVEVCPL